MSLVVEEAPGVTVRNGTGRRSVPIAIQRVPRHIHHSITGRAAAGASLPTVAATTVTEISSLLGNNKWSRRRN